LAIARRSPLRIAEREGIFMNSGFVRRNRFRALSQVRSS
jgi:hypothetical protein